MRTETQKIELHINRIKDQLDTNQNWIKTYMSSYSPAIERNIRKIEIENEKLKEKLDQLEKWKVCLKCGRFTLALLPKPMFVISTQSLSYSEDKRFCENCFDQLDQREREFRRRAFL